MFCAQCGIELPAGSTVCSNCGRGLLEISDSRNRDTFQGAAEEDDEKSPQKDPTRHKRRSRISRNGLRDTYVPPEESFASGRRLMDRYEIVCELGRGGMGVVYQAIDHGREVDIALKTVPPELRRDPRAIAMLKREVNTALILTHENICRVYDFQEAPQTAFITMELIDGHSLDELLFRQEEKGVKGFPLEWVLKCLRPVCAALDYAHGKGIVHRDLKPGNVMLTRNGTVKLTDFGLARAIRTSMSKYSREAMSGTLLYMSPEQCLGKPTDARSDVYSLGMMTYELLTGAAPFADAADITYCQLRADIDPIANQPDPVNAVLRKACSKTKEERHESAGTFLETLKQSSVTKQPYQTAQKHRAEVKSSAKSKMGRLLGVDSFLEAFRRSPQAKQPALADQNHRTEAELDGTHKPGDKKTVELGGGVSLDLVWIPPGEFMMGDEDGYEDEKPVHRVCIPQGFWIGRCPITQAQWKAIAGNNPSFFRGDRNPVEQVSWSDCQEFVKKLSQQAGDKFRLPTEAEWEYACRAQSTTAYHFGDGAFPLGNYAWYRENSAEKTHPVGQKLPNAWGLCDMHGNVNEWCEDWYDENFYKNSPKDDPINRTKGRVHVLRGGGWSSLNRNCRSADRCMLNPSYTSYGFRVACVSSS